MLPLLSLCLVAGFTVTSCKKKQGCTDPAATNYDEEAKEDDGSCVMAPSHGSATITGVLKANLNLSNDTNAVSQNDWENAPSSAMVVATYNEKDLYTNPAPGVTYGTVTVEATVSGGEYTLDIPANGKPVNVTVRPMDFAYDQVQGDGKTKVRKVYTYNSFNVSVYNGSYEIVDVYYN